MPGKLVTTSATHRPRRPFPSRLVAVGMAVLVAGLVCSSVFRKRGQVSIPDPNAPQAKSETVVGPVAEEKGKEPVTTESGDPTSNSEDTRDGATTETAELPNTTAGEPDQPKADQAAIEKKQREEARRLKHHTEQLLGMIISTREMGVPPVPISEEDEESLRRDLLAAITNDIVIYDDEDSRTQEVKERVADAKRQLAEILQKGGSVVEAIKEYEAYVNEGAKVRSEVLAKVAPEVDAIEDDVKALEYVESVNEALKKEDIPPIKPEDVGFEEATTE